MAKIQLTSQFVKNAGCTQGKNKVDFFDADCKGLLLEVRASGGKTWYMRYLDERGKAHQLKLADERDVSLAQARKLADKLRNQIALGIDPAAEKVVLRAAPTFANFMAGRYMPYVKGYKRSWRCDGSYLRNHLLPAFGKKHLDEITKHDVIAFHHGLRAKDYMPLNHSQFFLPNSLRSTR